MSFPEIEQSIISKIQNMKNEEAESYFQDLKEEEKTKSVCKEAFLKDVDMTCFPDSIMSEEFVLEALDYNGEDYNTFIDEDSIPEKFLTDKVLMKAIELCPEHLILVPYERQTQEMVDRACLAEHGNPFAIDYANPLLLSSKHVSDSWNDTNVDIYIRSYAKKYDELLEMYKNLLKNSKE